MEQLAEDTLRFIFLQLPPMTILALSMCCRRFNQIVTGSCEIQIILRRHLYNLPQQPLIRDPLSSSDRLRIIRYNEDGLTQLIPTAITTYSFPTALSSRHGLEVFLIDHDRDIIISIPNVSIGHPGKWLLCHVFHKGESRLIHTTFNPFGATWNFYRLNLWPNGRSIGQKACPFISIEDDVIVIRQLESAWGFDETTQAHIFHLFGDGDMAKPHTNPPLRIDHDHVDIRCPRTIDDLLNGHYKIVIDGRGALIYSLAKDLPLMQFPVFPEYNHDRRTELENLPDIARAGPDFFVLYNYDGPLAVYDAQKACKDGLPFGETKPVMWLNLPSGYDTDILTNSIEKKGILVLKREKGEVDGYYVILPYTSLAILYNSLKADKHNISGMRLEDGVPVWEMCQWSHLSAWIDCLHIQPSDSHYTYGEPRSIKFSGLRLVDCVISKEGRITVKLYDFNTRIIRCHDVNNVLGGLSDILEHDLNMTTPNSENGCRRTKYLKTLHPATEKSIAYTEYEAEFEPISNGQVVSLVNEYVIQEFLDRENLLIVVTGGRIFNFRFSLHGDFATDPTKLEV